jgi:mitotic-spindle organizing protein 1
MDNSNKGNFSQLDVEEARETIEILNEMGQILNCGLDRQTISILVSMIEMGVNPEALSAVIQEMRRENYGLGNSK